MLCTHMRGSKFFNLCPRNLQAQAMCGNPITCHLLLTYTFPSHGRPQVAYKLPQVPSVQYLGPGEDGTVGENETSTINVDIEE